MKWLRELVDQHKAVDLKGNGYPNRFSVAAGVLLPILGAKLPPNDSPPVFGDDYITPAAWSGNVALNTEIAAQCDPQEQLLIEAWDQS